MLRAVKIRLYPNKEQELKLNKVLGCYRFVYNQIGFMHTEGIQGTSGGSSNYKAFFDCFNFSDGTPFGIREC